MKNIQFLQEKRAHISVGELLPFFGVSVLPSRFGKRHDLWKTGPTSKYIPVPMFGKTSMSRNRFDEISVGIRFSDQPKSQREVSSVRYCSKFVNDFVSAVNMNRRTMITPSRLI
jgi:Transposase IS4